MSDDVTAWLRRLSDDGTAAQDSLVPLVYEELRRIAARAMRNEHAAITLQPTALVHEAWMRIVQQHGARYNDRSHFFAIAAQIMRRILVDQARRRRAEKRDGGVMLTLDRAVGAAAAEQDVDDVLRVHDALDALAAIDARQARVVELRFFAGMTNEEIAQLLGVSDRTVKRDWTVARAWLHRALADD